MYPITTPTGVVHYPPEGRFWSMIEREFEALKATNRIWYGQDNSGQPNVIRYIDEIEGFVPWTWWPSDEVGHTDEAKKEMHELFGKEDAFPTPKPMRLLKRIVEIATRRDSVVLDSFAGSGTTAHAVLAQNANDGGNRKFIMVECEDYADPLTAERMRRAINGYGYQGTKREELLREGLSFTKLQNIDMLVAKVQSFEDKDRRRFDRVKKEIKGGDLIVTGETTIRERVNGLGGSFTYCELGDPIELDRLLTGESLPSFEALASVLFHMATNEAFNASAMELPALGLDAHGYVGESSGFHVWLIYKPDLDFLKSPIAALTLAKAQAISETKPDKRNLVFAPARFVSQKMLNDAKLPLEFAPLPFGLYRVEMG